MRTFFPQETETVDASAHGDGAEYVVGVGSEIWPGNEAVLVLKAQIAHNGKVAGRRAPSFPILDDADGCKHSPDFDKVVAKAEELLQPRRDWLITWENPASSKNIGALVHDALKKAFNLEDDELNNPFRRVFIVQIQACGTAEHVMGLLQEELRKNDAAQGTKVYAARLAEAELAIV